MHRSEPQDSGTAEADPSVTPVVERTRALPTQAADATDLWAHLLVFSSTV